jgi:hypothetical protein
VGSSGRNGWSDEGPFAQAADPGGNRDVSQAGAKGEGASLDFGEAVWEIHPGQLGASRKRIEANGGDAIGDGVAASSPHRELNQFCAVLIEDDSIDTAESRVGRIHGECGQSQAPLKRTGAELGNTRGNGVASEASARELQQRGLVLVEQHAVQIAIGRIQRINADLQKIGALRKSSVGIGDAGGKGDALNCGQRKHGRTDIGDGSG